MPATSGNPGLRAKTVLAPILPPRFPANGQHGILCQKHLLAIVVQVIQIFPHRLSEKVGSSKPIAALA